MEEPVAPREIMNQGHDKTRRPVYHEVSKCQTRLSTQNLGGSIFGGYNQVDPFETVLNLVLKNGVSS